MIQDELWLNKFHEVMDFKDANYSCRNENCFMFEESTFICGGIWLFDNTDCRD